MFPQFHLLACMNSANFLYIPHNRKKIKKIRSHTKKTTSQQKPLCVSLKYSRKTFSFDSVLYVSKSVQVGRGLVDGMARLLENKQTKFNSN